MKRIPIKIHIEKLKKKFQLTIFNESTLENFFSLRVSALDGIFLGLTVFLVLFFLSYLLLVRTPLRSMLPQDLDPKLRNQMVQEAARVDSLTEALDMQSQYLTVVKGIVAGQVPIDSLTSEGKDIPLDSLAKKHFKLMDPTHKEQRFREDYEENERFNLSVLEQQPQPEELLFHPPAKGKIVAKLNPRLKQYGIRIQTADLQPILSVLDGTVLFSGYTADFDYVLQILHVNDYITVYKFQSEVLKKQGDKVKAGEAVGFAGNLTSGGLPGIGFELWRQGEPLNPEDYIVF